MSQPTVKWAQRKDRLFVTIDVQDVTGEEVNLTDEKIVFTGKVRLPSRSNDGHKHASHASPLPPDPDSSNPPPARACREATAPTTK